MKYLILGMVFLGIPFGLLNWVVMPQLQQLKTFYGQIDTVAQRAADPQPSSLNR
jgi:hypothetical protein